MLSAIDELARPARIYKGHGRHNTRLSASRVTRDRARKHERSGERVCRVLRIWKDSLDKKVYYSRSDSMDFQLESFVCALSTKG